MGNLRKYGQAPFSVVVVHGGPGAGGEMGPVACELAVERGVLEPIQTEASVRGQVEELRMVVEQNGDLPVGLIGFSWGAWLSFIFAANHPDYVKKLILVGSGPYEEKYAEAIQNTRFTRLGEGERKEVESLIGILESPGEEGKNQAFKRLGELFSKADAYDLTAHEFDALDCRFDIFKSVWREASGWRRRGRLLSLAKRIRCPVAAIHGDCDPHPAEGVREPLSANLENFRFILLEKCGHKPWIEREARKEFFRILLEEVRDAP